MPVFTAPRRSRPRPGGQRRKRQSAQRPGPVSFTRYGPDPKTHERNQRHERSNRMDRVPAVYKAQRGHAVLVKSLGRPELAHLVRNVRRATRPGIHEGVHRQVPRGFPLFSCRGGRYGPAVTGAVQPMLPAAGLAIRLRPGLSRRRSSTCAAAGDADTEPAHPPGRRNFWHMRGRHQLRSA